VLGDADELRDAVKLTTVGGAVTVGLYVGDGVKVTLEHGRLSALPIPNGGPSGSHWSEDRAPQIIKPNSAVFEVKDSIRKPFSYVMKSLTDRLLDSDPRFGSLPSNRGGSYKATGVESHRTLRDCGTDLPPSLMTLPSTYSHPIADTRLFTMSKQLLFIIL